MFKARLREMLNRRGMSSPRAPSAFPIVILLVMAMINLSLAGFASVNAANAANTGRALGVYQQGSAARPTPPHRNPFPALP